MTTRQRRTATRSAARAGAKSLARFEREEAKAAPYFREGVRRIAFSSLCKPTDRQRELLRAVYEAPFTLYGGARGGGKSYILRWLAIHFLLKAASQGFTNVRVGIFCETYPELWDRQLSRATEGRPEEQYPAWLGSWHKATREFHLHPQYGSGIVCFRNLDDPSKYQSAEFAAVLVDELTKNPIEVFNTLRGSRRWPGMDHTPFVGATNPGSIGHAWVKDIWVDGTFMLEETKNLLEAYGRTAFRYVKALASDNPHVSASYLTELRSLPDKLRRAFLFGEWTAFEGMAFDEWTTEVHVVPNLIGHLKGWRWVAGLDWGWRRGAYVLCALNEDTGQVVVVWEAYFSRIYAEAAAYRIFAASRAFPTPEQVLYDGQMDAEPGVKAGLTLRTEFANGMLRAFGSLERAPSLLPGGKGPGSRAVKYQRMHRYLAWVDKRDAEGRLLPWCRPLLTVQARCRHGIRTLPALPVDPDTPDEDVDTDAEDHWYDALCFVLLALPEPPAAKEPPSSELTHPGIDPARRRRRPQRTQLTPEERPTLPIPSSRAPYESPAPEDEGWDNPYVGAAAVVDDLR